jgi:crossover junction endodeoxyribonuclease RusA
MRGSERPVETLAFVVLGEPSPEGSTKAFYIKKLNRTVTTHQNQKSLEAWRNRVATEAQRALEGKEWVADCSSAYEVDVEFVLSRPPSVPEHKRIHPIVKPDIDKLVRAINDALTGILFTDDCQVVSMTVSKDYGDERRPGAYIVVSRYSNQTERPRKGRKKLVEKVARLDDCPCDDPRDD